MQENQDRTTIDNDSNSSNNRNTTTTPICLYTKKREFIRSTSACAAEEGIKFPLTCNTWIKSSTQRTQILYRADIASILYYMCIQLGDTVIESGTGTLSLTYALSQAVGMEGKVHTVERNRERYNAALKDISYAQMGNTLPYNDTIENFILSTSVRPTKIVLDIPEPEHILPGALNILLPGGSLCCFVPCIEQVQRLLLCLSTIKIAEAVQEPSAVIIDHLLEVVEIPHKPVSLAPDVYGTVVAEKIRSHTGYLLFLHKNR